MEALFMSTGIVALAEVGDKALLATVALAARYDGLTAVVMGTTLRNAARQRACSLDRRGARASDHHESDPMGCRGILFALGIWTLAAGDVKLG